MARGDGRLVDARRRRCPTARSTTATCSTTTSTPLPDPRSRRQPDGVHERSRTFDPAAYAWTDGAWTGRQLAGAVHLRAARRHLHPRGHPRRRDRAGSTTCASIGVDLVELLPVNAFNGTHNWGYDGVALVRRARGVRRPGGVPALRRRLPRRRARRRPGRRLQPPRPVGQLPAAVRALPQGRGANTWGDLVNLDGEDSARGAPLHPRQRARCGCATTTSTALRLDAVHALEDTSRRAPAGGDGDRGRRALRPPAAGR